jgi:hypothetical protein
VSPECENCGTDLNVNPVEKPNVDWVKVVCSDCSTITHISMVRLSKEVKE